MFDLSQADAFITKSNKTVDKAARNAKADRVEVEF
jgi:hypothetical protein